MATRSDRGKILNLFVNARLFQARAKKEKNPRKREYQEELRNTALREAERLLDACELSIAFMISTDVFAGKIDGVSRRFLLRYLLFRIIEIERRNQMDSQEVVYAIQRNVFSPHRLQEILQEIEKKESVFGVKYDYPLKIQMAALWQLELQKQCCIEM